MEDRMEVAREQIHQLRSEVERLRELSNVYIPRLHVMESQITEILKTIDRLETDLEEGKLTDRELQTDWKLAIALGGLLGTFLVGVVIWLATH